MLNKVKTKSQKLDRYKKIADLEEIRVRAKKLKGLKVIHVNSAPDGGGPAEIFRTLIPLMNDVGLKAEWQTIPVDKKFFEITKQIHNGLQGQQINFKESFKKEYLKYTQKTAKLIKNTKADIWVLHDPQPMGLVDYLENSSVVSRVHVDSSNPNLMVWNFLKGFLSKFNRIIFSAKDFVQKDIPRDKVNVFAPAIDAFSVKNNAFSFKKAQRILSRLGINIKNPLIFQVARFDPFKDPIGVINAYRIAKKKIPNLQLGFAGLIIADDDPEAKKILKEVEKEAKGDKDIFLFSSLKQIDNLSVDEFVNACQVDSDIILQKSLKEGFGLSVTEAMWKEKAVIAGKVGGIKLQIKNGENGFLVSSEKETAERIIQLFENEKLRDKLGKEAKKSVQEKFLMPRLLNDYLKLFESLT